MITEQFHFIHGLKRGEKFGLTDRIAVQSAWTHNPEWRVRFWCPEEPTGQQWELLREKVPLSVENVPDNHEWNGFFIQHHQHRADLLRHTLLYALGGMYLDLDTITLAPIPNHWRQYDTVIGVERSHGEINGLCNAVMLSKQFSQFQWQWLTMWQNFKGDDWNEFSVRAPWLLSKVFPRLVLPVEKELTGLEYDKCLEYFEKDVSLEAVVVAHLWATGTRRYLKKLQTVQDMLVMSSTYTKHAERYL